MTRRFQLVWWWERWALWPLISWWIPERAWRMVYRWAVRVGPLELRRWA